VEIDHIQKTTTQLRGHIPSKKRKDMSWTSKSRRVAFALAAAATVTVLVGCAAGQEPSEDLTLTLAVDDLVEGWDSLQPGDVLAAGTVDAQMVFDTLMYWDSRSGTGEPRLATGYEIADDGLSLVVELRDDVTFVDDVHFDAAALVTYFTAVIDNGFASVLKDYGSVFEATGDYTVTITTTKPIYAPEFLPSVLSVLIQSPAVLDDPELALREPQGSGPYLIEETDPEAERTYVRNPDYFNPERYPYDRIVLKVLVDATAKLNALKSGQVDVAQVEPTTAAEAEGAGLVLHTAPTSTIGLVVKDAAESELAPLRDVRVRQAISYAFDRQAIVDTILNGYGVATSQPFSEGQPEWVEGGDDRYDYDPERARELMAEAGYADGFDVTLPGTSLITTPYEPIVTQALGDIGIRVTWESLEIGDWTVATWGGKYPLFLTIPSGEYLIFFLSVEIEGLGQLIHSTQEVLDLAADIKGSDPERSAAASRELGELMLEEAQVVPIVTTQVIWASDPAVDIDTTKSVGDGLLGPGLHRFSPAD
jgi:peptide/nickel transport system substrate-binding protein